jgi:hypothetical protein
MLQTTRVLLPVCLMLVGAAAASGQANVPPEKQAAIAKLIELENPQARSYAIFSRVTDRFRDASAGMLIKGARASGLFRKLSPKEGAELERRLRVFDEDIYAEYKTRVLHELITSENIARGLAPIFAREFTLEELNEAIAFDQSPLGRKLLAAFPEALADSSVAVMEAKGFFAEPPSPQEAVANITRLTQEIMADPAGYVHQVFDGATPAIEKQLTPDEIKELRAFRETSFGRRYGEIHTRLHNDSLSLFYGQRAPQAMALMNEIQSRKIKEYMPWLDEASRPGALRGGPKPPPGKQPAKQ